MGQRYQGLAAVSVGGCWQKVQFIGGSASYIGLVAELPYLCK